MNPDLPDRLKAAEDRCKLFPEIRRNDDGTFTVRGDAFIAFLELRALVPELQLALHELSQVKPGKGAFVRIPRIEESEG